MVIVESAANPAAARPGAADSAFRSGSAVSILTTINGLYLRHAGGWLPTAALVDFAVEAGISAPLARTSIARLKKRGVYVPERRERAAGYRLSDSALKVISRGDRRILSPQIMQPEDRWCLVSFSVPETQRHVRGRLRRRLELIGCGMVSAALWIAPEFLLPEIDEILHDLEVRDFAVLFRADAPLTSLSLAEAITQWWNLPEIAALHAEFNEVARSLLGAEESDDRDAFRRFVVGTDAWRPVPYLDPGLPYALLPPDWPGRESAELFPEIRRRFAGKAQAFVDARLSAGRESL